MLFGVLTHETRCFFFATVVDNPQSMSLSRLRHVLRAIVDGDGASVRLWLNHEGGWNHISMMLALCLVVTVLISDRR